MEVDHLTKEEKEQLVRYLMKCYRSSKRNIDYLKECDLVQEKKEEYRNDKKTCFLIESALEEIDFDQRVVLEEEFMRKKKLEVILGNYSRSNYYRLRNQAVDHFLRCL